MEEDKRCELIIKKDKRFKTKSRVDGAAISGINFTMKDFSESLEDIVKEKNCPHKLINQK